MESDRRIAIDRSLTIDRVADLKEKFLAVLERSPGIILDLSRIRSVDTAGLQFLISLVLECRMQRKSFILDGTLPESIVHSGALVGILPNVGEYTPAELQAAIELLLPEYSDDDPRDDNR